MQGDTAEAYQCETTCAPTDLAVKSATIPQCGTTHPAATGTLRIHAFAAEDCE
jgi:hypothetical protein